MNFSSYLFLWPAAWIIAIFGTSIAYRRSRGRPIVPKKPVDSVFFEKNASTRWASKCLIVAVTPTELTITPQFPFTLGFFPEMYGVEHSIPLTEIQCAEAYQGWLGLNTKVHIQSRPKPLLLKLKEQRHFIDVIGSNGSSL